jgi:hypothetical protein
MKTAGEQMSRQDILCAHMPNVCLKLQTLRDSCSGVFQTQTYPPSITWFDAAAAICQEAIDWIEEVVLILTRADEKTIVDRDNDLFKQRDRP